MESWKGVYGDELISKKSSYMWFKKFYEGKEQVVDEHRTGALKRTCKEENIKEVQKLVMQNHQTTVGMISEAVGVSNGTVMIILTSDLKLHKICAKFVDRTLSDN